MVVQKPKKNNNKKKQIKKIKLESFQKKIELVIYIYIYINR